MEKKYLIEFTHAWYQRDDHPPSIEEALNEINRARYMLPDRPSLEEAIKNGMHKNVLNKLEQEMLINEEANFLGLNVPLSEQMRLIKEENALLAGELSGHIFFKDKHYGYDDALYAALRLIEIISN